MDKIRFAHLADLHLGSWKEKTLYELNFKIFQNAISKIITEKLDFVLISGDLFNTALPPIEILNITILELLRLKDLEIPVYIIGGSHDYSNSGKSFISILETARLVTDVSKFEISGDKILSQNFIDKKTNALISGILGRKNGIDKKYYDKQFGNLPNSALKIFMFHGEPKNISYGKNDSKAPEYNLDYLPKGFNYYAGGHIHKYYESKLFDGIVSYPGPLFPNNFSELKTESPSFNIVEFSQQTKQISIQRQNLKNYELVSQEFDLSGLNSLQAKEKQNKIIENTDFNKKIVLLEFFGTIDGKVSDLELSKFVNKLYDLGAKCVLKNTYKLSSSIFDENYTTEKEQSIELIEKEIFENFFTNDYKNLDLKQILLGLFDIDFGKNEDEKNQDYENRIIKIFEQVLNT